MGIADAFQFTLGFAILDDLTDCSSETITYVERRRFSTQDKSKSKSKQSTTAAANAQTYEKITTRHGATAAGAGAATVKGPETARSTTAANLNVKEEDTRLRDAAITNFSAKRSIALETIAKRSTITAPAALGRGSSRRSRQEKREEEGERENETSKKEENKQETKKEVTDAEILTTSKHTTRSISRTQTAKSREPSHAPLPSEAGTKADVSAEELRKENRALRRRTERLEKDLAVYRRHAEHYRDRKREAERERLKAEERVRELETVVTNMRDSYELELEDLRGQITEYAAKAAAMASATKLYAKDVTGQTEERGQTPASKQEAAPVQKSSSVHEVSVQTDPWPLPPRPANPPPGTTIPTGEDTQRMSLLIAKLEQKDAELRAFKLFHDETPQILLGTLTNSVAMLNTELRNLAISMASTVPLGRTWEPMQAWALDAAEPGLARCLRLLSGVKNADFGQDITLVRLALQAWIISCLQHVFEKFLFGLENAEDEMLRRVFERVQTREFPPVAARWRVISHRHARTLAMIPVTSPSTSGGGYSAARDHAIHLLEMDILVGAEAILRFAGAHSPPGVLLSELSSTHGRRISRLVKRVSRLANDLAERAPVGCEVFTVHLGEDEDDRHEHEEAILCGCMESVDQECRQWVGQVTRTERGGRTAGTRTRTHTRAGTVRNKSKTRSHARTARTARTATTRTYADTNIRQWDRDSDEDLEESEEDEGDVEEAEEEDEFVENVDIRTQTGGDEHPTVLCSLGFGLRRVLHRPRRRTARTGADSRQPSQETLQRERPRVPKVETLHGSTSDAKSMYALTTPTASPETLRRRSHQYTTASQANLTDIREGTVREGESEGREVEVLVKTDVLMSSTVDSLRQRVVQ